MEALHYEALLKFLLAFWFVAVAKAECDLSDQQRGAIDAEALKLLQSVELGTYDSIQGTLYFNQLPGIGNPDGKYGVVDLPASTRPLSFNAYCRKMAKQFPQIMDQERRFCNLNFAMASSDALVWNACLPPESEYFSLSTVLSLRFQPDSWAPLAQYGDSINQLVVNSTAGKGNFDPFCKTALFIVTADEVTFHSIRTAYTRAGFPMEAINLYPLPAEEINFRHGIWYLNKYDLLAIQFRINGGLDQAAVGAYLAANQTVHLVRRRRGWAEAALGLAAGLMGRAPAKPARPVPMPPLRPRGDGASEFANHARDLEDLKDAVREFYEGAGYRLLYEVPFRHVVPDLGRCRTDPAYAPTVPPQAAELYNISTPGCDWFTRDALYSFPGEDVDLGLASMTATRVVVAVGLNQVLMGKCNFYNFLFSAGSFGQFEDPDHGFDFSCSDAEGSAHIFGPQIKNVDKMIAWTIARPGVCDDLATHQSSTLSSSTTATRKSRRLDDWNNTQNQSYFDTWCKEISEEQISGLFYAVERKYLEPSTYVGASPDEVIPPSLLVFDIFTDDL